VFAQALGVSRGGRETLGEFLTHLATSVGSYPWGVTLCLEAISRVWKGSYDQVKTPIVLFICNSGPVGYFNSEVIYMNKDR